MEGKKQGWKEERKKKHSGVSTLSICKVHFHYEWQFNIALLCHAKYATHTGNLLIGIRKKKCRASVNPASSLHASLRAWAGFRGDPRSRRALPRRQHPPTTRAGERERTP